eukprot:15476791-Alexandrium_andersonii.AAC.1
MQCNWKGVCVGVCVLYTPLQSHELVSSGQRVDARSAPGVQSPPSHQHPHGMDGAYGPPRAYAGRVGVK